MIEILFTLFLVHGVVVMSPGPDFFMVSQTSVSSGNQAGLFASLGVTMGIVVWEVLTLMGLKILFDAFPGIRIFVMVLGGLYLCYLSFELLRGVVHKTEGQNVTPVYKKTSYSKAFLKGLFTNLSNAKGCIYFSSIFTALLPEQISFSMAVAVITLTSIETLVWFGLVSLVFSRSKVRALYCKGKKVIDSLAAGIFGVFGVRLVGELIS